MKASAAKIVSLATSRQIGSPLFPRSQKHSHFVYLCLWRATDEQTPYDYRKKSVGMRRSRIPTDKDISVMV